MSSERPTVLVVDDEQAIRRFLITTLEGSGYDVEAVGTGQEALTAAAQRPPTLIILDLGLPGISGQQVLAELRAWSRIPVIVLSAIGREQEKVDAFNAGADDYLTKPFGVPELLARIRAMLRRTAIATADDGPQGRYQVGELTVDFTTRRVVVGARDIRLTPTEYRLLSLMAQHAGKVLTHLFLLRQVWGPEHSSEVNYLRVFMAGLRRKVEADSTQPRYLLTEQGVGYRLADA
ncbi:MAG: response regulator transcription factor [Planctomycetia bacterium]|nr:response regulator transcription factor [Planctomycetia bacterium]